MISYSSMHLNAICSLCYGLNICVPLDSYVEILIPSVMVWGDETFENWLCLEGEALVNGINTLKKGTSESSYSIMGRQSEKTDVYETGGGLQQMLSPSVLILDFSTSRTVRKSLLLKGTQHNIFSESIPYRLRCIIFVMIFDLMCINYNNSTEHYIHIYS